MRWKSFHIVLEPKKNETLKRLSQWEKRCLLIKHFMFSPSLMRSNIFPVNLRNRLFFFLEWCLNLHQFPPISNSHLYFGFLCVYRWFFFVSTEKVCERKMPQNSPFRFLRRMAHPSRQRKLEMMKKVSSQWRKKLVCTTTLSSTALTVSSTEKGSIKY